MPCVNASGCATLVILRLQVVKKLMSSVSLLSLTTHWMDTVTIYIYFSKCGATGEGDKRVAYWNFNSPKFEEMLIKWNIPKSDANVVMHNRTDNLNQMEYIYGQTVYKDVGI